ncbi:MAG TPA: Gfo/Idh/MocA family oxidoreductase [Planctomycetota bacterium]|nr:Gfo/Idh/MocA family oxidoreductase [Planctomycetota bacterium]
MAGAHEPRGLTRRAFLKATAAVAAPLVLPNTSFGANERVTMGLLGSGGQGSHDMRGFLGCPGLQVVAVCDVQESRRNAARTLVNNHYSARAEKDYKGCEAYNDFREVIARDDVDTVLIAPQDHWHAIMAIQAAEAGKDMYCEKPLGVSVQECQAIRDAIRRYGRVFQTGTQQRSDRKFRQACELARNGYLGKLHTVKVGAPGPSYQPRYRGPITPEPVPPGFDYEMFVGPAPMKPWHHARLDWPGWYLIWDYCAGFIVNWGVHHLDIAHWGCPALAEASFELTCTADYRNLGLTDNVNGWNAEFVYPSGLRMSFTDTGRPNAQGCRFEGDKGWVHVNRGGIHADPPSLLQVTLKPDDIHLHLSNHHQADFVEGVRQRSDPVSTVEAGLLASYFGMIADIAGRVRRKVKWDPIAERFDNDAEATRLLSRPMRAPWTL